MALSGCVSERIDRTQSMLPHDGTFYVLDLVVDILAPHAKGQQPLTLGAHCAQAYLDDTRWHIDRGAVSATAGDGPLVIVRPTYTYPAAADGQEGWHWLSFGSEPELVRMPFEMGPAEVYDPETGASGPMQPLVAQMELFRGDLYNLGVLVDVPYTWEIHDRDGVWHASLTLVQGRGPYEEFSAGPCM